MACEQPGHDNAKWVVGLLRIPYNPYNLQSPQPGGAGHRPDLTWLDLT